MPGVRLGRLTGSPAGMQALACGALALGGPAGWICEREWETMYGTWGSGPHRRSFRSGWGVRRGPAPKWRRPNGLKECRSAAPWFYNPQPKPPDVNKGLCAAHAAGGYISEMRRLFQKYSPAAKTISSPPQIVNSCVPMPPVCGSSAQELLGMVTIQAFSVLE